MNAISLILNLPWTCIGCFVALISLPKKVSWNTRPPALICSVQSLWWLFGYLKYARAVAMGNVVILSTRLEKGDLEHELVHVEQAQNAPLVYPVLYLVELMQKGYANNKYEIEAYARAGNIYCSKYRGTIILESLEDVQILDGFTIRRKSKTDGIYPWHLYSVACSRADIEILSKVLKKEGWYAHFWNGITMIVVYRDKIFEFEMGDDKARETAVMYGLSVGIPKEQLDFKMDEL